MAAGRDPAAAAAAAGAGAGVAADLWSLTAADAAAAAAPGIALASLSKQRHPAPQSDATQEPAAKQRQTKNAAAVAPPAAAPAAMDAVVAAAGLQHLPGGHIPFTHFLEAGRLWLLSRQLSAGASMVTVQAIYAEVSHMWQFLLQLCKQRFLLLSIEAKEIRRRTQEQLQFTWRGGVVLLDGSAQAVQLKQQLGHLHEELTPAQKELLQDEFEIQVDAKVSSEAEQARFELGHSKPLFKLCSVFRIGDRQDGGGTMQQEQSAGCSTEAPWHAFTQAWPPATGGLEWW
ncbi:hypothetical protein COO60DRAFT_1478358 [Scenedesmus sp. NREL 46B-D3]|nr:hypothetical protein COO60DRAFT_1478358 [Scenedesmus sp. NREL 46B-D3]